MFEKDENGEDWRADAKCRGMEISGFFKPNVNHKIKVACANCPVREKCLDHAIRYEEFGFWGGTGPGERRYLRKKLGIKAEFISVGRIAEPKEPTEPLMPIEHGTRSGYQLHVKRKLGFELPNGEDCGCRKANSLAIKQYRQRKMDSASSRS